MSYDESIDHPGKIVACGPYKGYVQYSIWAPASDDPEDVRVSVDDDLSRLIIEIRGRVTAHVDAAGGEAVADGG